MSDEGHRPSDLDYQESFETAHSIETPTSDFQDPELEFDVEGLDLAAREGVTEPTGYRPSGSPVLAWDLSDSELSRKSSEGVSAPFRGGSITPDGLIDEDFEQEIGQPIDEEEAAGGEFHDIAQLGIIEVAGDDVYGRKVIVFSACKLPPRTELDHGRLLEYMRHTLDQYVEMDYIMVYFHHGLTGKTKPKLSWLVQVYRDLDRKYKKNLKALYLVHPTNFIRVLWAIFRPIISGAKFGRKVMYINYLHELKEHLHFDQLKVPKLVLQYNAKLLQSHKPSYPYQGEPQRNNSALKTQQFGVTLYFIKSNAGCVIPPVVQQTVEYLRLNALDSEGIFRRTANAAVLKRTQQQFNEGVTVDFDALYDVTIPAVTLKTFLRELQEPLLTFELYEPIMKLHGQEKDRQVVEARRMLLEELPEDNYVILKYIIDLLVEVAAHSDKNKMTTQNLAIVFGPNLIWPKGQASLNTMGYINMFALLLLDNYDVLFTR